MSIHPRRLWKTISEFFGIIESVVCGCRQIAFFVRALSPLIFFCFAVTHPNTIAYPERFSEDAQAISTLSRWLWPDLSLEWIRRSQDWTSRGTSSVWLSLDALSLINSWRFVLSLLAVDSASNLPCLVVSVKKRLSLFTRKQQKLVRKVRKMKRVPDLSALLQR